MQNVPGRTSFSKKSLSVEAGQTPPEQKMHQREVSMCKHTGALLCKNLLTKWRNKKQSLQEWLLCLAVLFIVMLLAFVMDVYHMTIPEMPENVLGPLDEFNATARVIGYTPQTQSTKQIMEKVALELNGTGVTIEDFEDEKTLTEAWKSDNKLIGIVFKDSFSYQIRQHDMPSPFDHLATYASCYNYTDFCSAAKYWQKGFVFLQASLDAAIIEIPHVLNIFQCSIPITQELGLNKWPDKESMEHRGWEYLLTLESNQ